MDEKGVLKVGEPHPAAESAKYYIASLGFKELNAWLESFASCAIGENRLAEICVETLNRLRKGEPVSDRYLLGLAWTIKQGVNYHNKRKDKCMKADITDTMLSGARDELLSNIRKGDTVYRSGYVDGVLDLFNILTATIKPTNIKVE